MPKSYLVSPEGLQRLQAAKTERNLSFAAIAEQAGVSADTVSRLFHPERGNAVSEASFRKIANALKVSVEAIAQPDQTDAKAAFAEAEKRIQVVLETNSTELDLSGLGLRAVPVAISQLQNLTTLSLSQNQLTEVPKELSQLQNLTTLSLLGNQLTQVPKELGQLQNLTELYLFENQLASVPKELGRLQNLAWLDLSQNQLTEVPKELGQLVNLTKLYLSQNQLTEVPKELGQLVNLTELYLSQNQLTEVPKELGKLTNLDRLNLSQNQLAQLPKELGQLTNLGYLFLFRNRLSVLPIELGQLKNLIRFSLSVNQLTAVPKELGKLENLRVLSLRQNKLVAVPAELCQLKNLMGLYLDHNQLATLPEELVKLENLTELYLHGNQRLGISDELLGPTWEQAENGGATPANPKDILSYYFRTRSEKTPLNEAKLILVGFGAVGKTSLVNRLIHKKFDRDSKKTEGIQITQWPFTLNNTEDITLHVWDFGGQEIMHSTHQFFLTERSLYLLVLNGRQGHEDEDAEYWLELIESFGGDSPVIVVLNKITEHPFDVNRGALQQKFPNICAFIPTDCAAEIGLDELQTNIKQETDRLEFLRTPFPASWLTIKNKLAGMQKNYISYETYRDLCQQDGEADTRAQDSLANCLHSLGIALNYKDDPRLRDTHVLNPHWVTNGIYTLLNAAELAATQGEMAADCLDRTLDIQQYPRERHGFLLELMRKFELCFRFADDDSRFLIPDLLDKQQPAAAAEFDLAECLNFRYAYPVLPEGLLPRFIVRTHVLSEHQLRWRTGVILHFEGNRALVKADRADKCVTVSVDGPVNSRRRLLAIIRSDFERIHSSFKFTPQELVPVPAHPDVMLPYPDLIVMEQSGLQELPQVINGQIVKLNVRDLLNGVDLEGSRRADPDRRRIDTLHLFISYSHKDNALREELETHLKILNRQGLIQTWSDRCIIPGDEWETDIDANLNRADIILFLISADFIASKYCYEIEMPQAMARHENGEAVVIPVLLRPCDWRNTPFNKLGWLPKNGEPVMTWSDRDAAWLNVEQGIKAVIQQKKGDRLH
ncbi:MAG: COR domain-containing protein [Cyanobacteria bacterium P01_F01_bin.56]